tara:strand:- start:421 stop:1347 length:927 start_codon:yes stop_codon:yes gene_type:complete
MKAIMYHYVRPKENFLFNFRYLDINKFKKQLDYFESKYGFATHEEFGELIYNGIIPDKKNKILLTFDDGLKDHYDYVYKELKKRNLFGIFYIPTAPLSQDKILDVHKIHLICSKISEKKILKDLLSLIDERMIVKSRIEDFNNKLYLNQKNSIELETIKKLLNYFLSIKYKSLIINKLYTSYDINYKVKDIYLNNFEIKDMSKNGMIIGSHTVNHPVLSTLEREDQEKEILVSSSYLESLVDQKYKTMCFPYGGSHSYNFDTIDILKKNNFNFAFSVESKNIIKENICNSIFELPRYDCNEFNFGQNE